MPRAWRKPADLLSVKGDVQRSGRQPAQGIQGVQEQVRPAGEDVSTVRRTDGPRVAQGDHGGKVVGPDAKREVVHRLVEQRQFIERRVCPPYGGLSLSASVHRYVAKPKDDVEVIAHMMAVVEKNIKWGFRLVFDRMRTEGSTANPKRVHRVYKEADLHLRRRTKHRVPERVKDPIVLPIGPNIIWSMVFMSDALVSGRKYRTFNVIDDFNREARCIAVATSLPAQRVIRELEQLIEWRGKPKRLRMDNGPEFIAHATQEWAAAKGVEFIYIQPGRPMQNGLVERFNKTYHPPHGGLDAWIFERLSQVREIT